MFEHERNLQIIECRKRGWTYSAIAEAFGITRQRAHAITKRGPLPVRPDGRRGPYMNSRRKIEARGGMRWVY